MDSRRLRMPMLLSLCPAAFSSSSSSGRMSTESDPRPSKTSTEERFFIGKRDEDDVEKVDDDEEKEEKDFLEVDLLRKEAAAAAKAALLSFAEEDEEGRDTFLDSILGKVSAIFLQRLQDSFASHHAAKQNQSSINRSTLSLHTRTRHLLKGALTDIEAGGCDRGGARAPFHHRSGCCN